jgi:3D (Asp-Asp-Asp) domain-containing protein
MKIIKKISARIFIDLLILSLSVFIANPFVSVHGDFSLADTFNDGSSNPVYPYNQYFTISAYYSPLPCQNRYTTGSFEGDVRLNGEGVHSADGTHVYPGMVAAPKTYSFGTKMYIPGVGTVAVHDRGGAIVASNGQDGLYDRLDIWMGYGDIGLERALNWGKRTVEVTIYAVDDSIFENIFLADYSPDEANANTCMGDAPEIVLASDTPEIVNETFQSNLKFNVDLQLGDSGSGVLELQEELKNLNFFKETPDGVYGELTEHAVFKFQQSQMIIEDNDSLGAGVFGPKTRSRMNEIVTSRDLTQESIVRATNEA